MKKHTGFTLIELMISLVLGIMIVGTVLTIYISTIKSGSETINAVRLNHDLEAVVGLMTNDIRRAGYWGGATQGSDATNNPFVAATTDLQVMDYTDADGTVYVGGCLLYSYDADGNGYNEDPSNPGNDYAGTPIVVVNANEYYGFRQDRGSIWLKYSGATTADCDDGSWQQLVDETEVDIVNNGLVTPLFTQTYSCINSRSVKTYASDCIAAAATALADGDANTNFVSGDRLVEIRQIDISLTGQLDDDAVVRKTLTSSIKIRNDKHIAL
ncbi:MAG: prepilin-type N-terminal cleavage/methylation domain-containing protein [Methylococcales bacterium]|nr:prepilin-type N-terminal cleavage/methylation domain-containing protein [Methylococcales bacterium]